MSRAAVLLVLALLLGGVGAGVLAGIAVASAPGPEVVAAAPDEVVPAPSDRDILRAAAIGARVSVERDAQGALVMVLPGSYDARTVEQVVPAPAGPPAGTPWLLAAGAVLAVGSAGASAARRHLAWVPAGLALGVLAATGGVLLLEGTSDALAVGALLCAGLAAAGLAGCRAQAFSR